MPSSVHIDGNKGWGGGQAQSLGLALALSAMGEHTSFLPQVGSALATQLSNTYLQWEARSLRGLPGIVGIPRLTHKLKALHPDVVHIHDSAGHLTAGLAARLGTTAKIVVTRRTEFPLRRGTLGTLKYHLWCDRVVCISEAVRKRCLEAGLPADKLVVIPDFVDCRRFDAKSVAADRPGDGPVIVTIGALTRMKGHHILLRAMSHVAKAIPRTHLVVCGEGEEEQRLRHEATALKLSGSVTFLGFVSDVRAALARADVFVMPSLSEGLGVAVLEAMAMARPVVASDGPHRPGRRPGRARRGARRAAEGPWSRAPDGRGRPRAYSDPLRPLAHRPASSGTL